VIAPDRAVLTDFGIARDAGPSAATTAGLLIGSPSYIAPERARGGRPGPASDLWGLGASLYAAVEGHGPFDREGDALASLTAAVADELEPATHAGLLWPVISGLLRKNPDERLDAAAAERMLRRAAGSSAVAAGGPALTAPAQAVPAQTVRAQRAPAQRAPAQGAPAEGAPASHAGARARRSMLSAAALAIVASGISAGLALSGSPRHATAASLPAGASTRTPPSSHPPAAGGTRPTGHPHQAGSARPATPTGASAATGRAVQTDSLLRTKHSGKAPGHGRPHSHHARHGKEKGNGNGNGDSQD
jgi:hypothetical protein